MKVKHLHYAAEEGHFDLCKTILDHIEDKNPKDSNGRTPLDCATTKGFGEICELIIESVEDKNPSKKRRNF